MNDATFEHVARDLCWRPYTDVRVADPQTLGFEDKRIPVDFITTNGWSRKLSDDEEELEADHLPAGQRIGPAAAELEICADDVNMKLAYKPQYNSGEALDPHHASQTLARCAMLRCSRGSDGHARRSA